MVVVGFIGAGISFIYGLSLVFVAFCGVVGIGAFVVLNGGTRYVALFALTVGVLAAFLAILQIVRYDSSVLGLLFAVLSFASFYRGYQYYRAYST